MYCRGICIFAGRVLCKVSSVFTLYSFLNIVVLSPFQSKLIISVRLISVYTLITDIHVLYLNPNFTLIFGGYFFLQFTHDSLPMWSWRRKKMRQVCVCVWCKCCRFGVNYSAGRRLCWHPSSRVLIGWGGLEDLWRHGYSWRLLTADAWKYIMTLRSAGRVDWLVQATRRVWWGHYFFPCAYIFYS